MGLNDLVGLENLKLLAHIGIAYSNETGNPFPHSLVTGSGGLGKSEFARAIAHDTNAYFVELKPAALTTVAKVFKLLQEKGLLANQSGKYLFLFLDECHQLSKPIQESLYGLMESGKIENETELTQMNPLCLFGATTEEDKLNYESFISRFQNIWHMEPYSNLDISKIIYRKLSQFGLFISKSALELVSDASLGIPRKAVNFSKKLIEISIYNKSITIKRDDVINMLKNNQISEDGLTNQHIDYLKNLATQNKPVRLMWIIAKMQTNQGIIHRIEQELFRKDFIQYTPNGRILTEKGKDRIL